MRVVGGAYLLIVRLQDVVQPRDLSQLPQLHLHTLQRARQQLLVGGVQLLFGQTQDQVRGENSFTQGNKLRGSGQRTSARTSTTIECQPADSGLHLDQNRTETELSDQHPPLPPVGTLEHQRTSHLADNCFWTQWNLACVDDGIWPSGKNSWRALI